MYCFQDIPLSGTKTTMPISVIIMGDEQSTTFKKVCNNLFAKKWLSKEVNSTNKPI